jgi:2-succinyl-5-enolpyruvyl-6-hydroxy-3-cyclohexene-1-carboxylate synthase
MNRNTLFAQLFADSLIAAGLQHVCLAPGSRNTPLVLAFANRKDKISITSHLDERSMAFFALGLARAANTPVAIVCTSGSAAANFFPAIVEAHQSRIPLIVLTADRPPELRHSGANQTIDQVKMFGDYALWFVDTPLPEANPSQHLLRYVRTLAHRAFDTANGARKGVVHINMPFRPPLEPTDVEGDLQELPEEFAIDPLPYLPVSNGYYYADILSDPWEADICSVRRGLIVMGPNRLSNDWQVFDNLWDFAQTMGFPIIADGTSGWRFDDVSVIYGVIGGYESFLPLNLSLLQNIDLVIRIGDIPTSKTLNTYVDRLNPKFYYHVTDSVWADDSYRVAHVFRKEEWKSIMYAFERSGAVSADSASIANERKRWAAQVMQLEQRTWDALDEAVTDREFEGGFVYDMLNLMPYESILTVGNSMPVRHIDFWGRPNGKNIMVYANRGASGIDGNISTALGAGAAHKDQPLVLLIGDVTFYHDMNGLLAIQRCGVPIVIVLLNNNGGGIFRTLPVKDYEPSFTDYFITPHALDFSHVGPLYGLDHQRLATRAEFREAFPKAIDAWREGKSTLLEVMTDSNVDVATRREILAEVQEKLKSTTTQRDKESKEHKEE